MGTRSLPRYTNTTTLDAANVDRAVGNTNPTDIRLWTPQAGDLRGIPCLARGVGGTMLNTNPLTETIRLNP
jgi:hypothetical protein